eukprot:364833-Chlamydomonas_euryale.AAC.25
MATGVSNKGRRHRVAGHQAMAGFPTGGVAMGGSNGSDGRGQQGPQHERHRDTHAAHRSGQSVADDINHLQVGQAAHLLRYGPCQHVVAEPEARQVGECTQGGANHVASYAVPIQCQLFQAAR